LIWGFSFFCRVCLSKKKSKKSKKRKISNIREDVLHLSQNFPLSQNKNQEAHSHRTIPKSMTDNKNEGTLFIGEDANEKKLEIFK
jgi:hypothetical protein